MIVEHLGHAAFRVECDGKVLVTDPWFNPAFLGSWFPWPDNRYCEETARSADCLYISHAHEDHFDRKFLATVDKGTPVIVPKFRSRYLEREARKLGFTNVIALAHKEEYCVTDTFFVTMLIDRSHKEDSALLMQDRRTGYKFLDSNDCELAASDLPDDVDLLACQFSGASWYPHCYDYEPGVMATKVHEARESHFRRLCGRIRLTGAKSYLPSAGPPVFLDPELAKFSLAGEFTVFDDIAHRLRKCFPDLRIHRFLQGYPWELADYAASRQREVALWQVLPQLLPPVTAQEVQRHFRQLQRVNGKFLGGYQNDIRLWDNGSHWDVRLGLVDRDFEESFDPHYYLRVPDGILRLITDGAVTWETALLSQRVRLHRDPDKYDATLMELLQFGDRPAQTLAIEQARKSTEEVNHDGYVMQRWCPHAGEDMTCASVTDGVVECPRHNWRWDASTGECVSGGDIPLRIRKADD